jgi:H/ACA ribonucleoprotein complex subunit 3
LKEKKQQNKMSQHLYKCFSCQRYTLEKNCPKCQNETIEPKPPKFSLDDKYGDYRRQIKREQLKKENLY